MKEDPKLYKNTTTDWTSNSLKSSKSQDPISLLWIDAPLKLWSSWMCITETWSTNLNSKMYTKSVNLLGNLNFATIGRIAILGSEWSTLLSTSTISILVTQADWSLLHSLIDVIELYVVHSTWTMVALLRAQQEQVKLRPSRIWLKLWHVNVWSSIVQMAWITELWVNFSKVSLLQVLGHVSISLTVSIWKCCQSLLSRFWPSLSREKKARRSSSLKMLTSLLKLPATSSLPWILVMQAVLNFPTTWRLSSEQ